MNKRIHQTSAFFVREFLPEEWKALETAGRVTLTRGQKTCLRQSQQGFQQAVTIHNNSVPVASVRKVVTAAAIAWEAGCNSLLALTSQDSGNTDKDKLKGAAQRAALGTLQRAVGHASIVSRGSLESVACDLREIASAARKALADLPKEARGRNPDPGIDQLILDGAAIFDDAGGQPEFKQAFLAELSKLVGHAGPRHAPEGFKRRLDKTKLRQEKK